MTNGDNNWKTLGKKVESNTKYPDWLLSILNNRGLKKVEDIQNFLYPDYHKLVKSDNFLGINEAVKRIAEALENNEKIAVYGDYDVDGICSTALMIEILNKIGAQNVEAYIPHRENEGYGINKEAIDQLLEKGIGLVIAVDCGVNSKTEIESSSLDFIVIDHHEIDKIKMPRNSIIIHPALTKDENLYTFSAAGMVFLLARAAQSKFQIDFPDGQEKWLLDLVALSTICDVMPLTGDNRILTYYGLLVLRKTKRVGLRALIKGAFLEAKKIGAYEVGFVIGPRLNVAGRLEHAQTALDLLLTKDNVLASELANRLNNLNYKRQKLCSKILEEAKEEIEKKGNDKKIFLLSNKNWPRGVVGIVASRLAEDYSRPILVFENDGQQHHGSARSIDGFDITSALASCSEYLVSYGGHAKAAGLKVATKHFVAFSEKLLTVAEKEIDIKDTKKDILIDAEINEANISDEMMDFLTLMEPFGYGNRTPIFLIKKATIRNVAKVGNDGRHQKFNFSGIEAIAFNELRELKEENRYDLVFSLRYNYWNNRKKIEARIIDFKCRG